MELTIQAHHSRTGRMSKAHSLMDVWGQVGQEGLEDAPWVSKALNVSAHAVIPICCEVGAVTLFVWMRL